MANERVSPAERIRVQNLAEAEVMRYAGDHFMWHKHVHNVELDTMQVLKMVEMDQHPSTVDFSCRRTGKTSTKELWCLEYNATHADQEEGIVAPREAQAQVNLRYHTDAIRRSPILSNWLMYDRGRQQLNETRYQFANRSVAASYGIMAQVDGGDLTVASLEEVDDMPADRLYSRFLLMLGASRRLGASKSSVNKAIIRVTGVFKGADTLANMVADGTYHSLPTVDVHLGIEMGILDEKFMAQMRNQLPMQEYIRQLLCLNVSAKNLIWEKWVRKAITLGVRVNLSLQVPMPGVEYRKRGPLSFGYDHLGHGEDPHASKAALVVLEELGLFKLVIFAKTWGAGTDDALVKNDLKSFWRYFRPDYAMGDAYGVGMLTTLNDELFREGLTMKNRQEIGGGESTASTWKDWAFAPIRFEGMTKHQMAQVLASDYKNGRMVMPLVDDMDQGDPAAADMLELQRQLPNMVAEPTTKAYSSYVRQERKINDDLFDAMMAASHALSTRGTGDVSTIILLRQVTEASLLGQGFDLPDYGFDVPGHTTERAA